MAVMQMVPGMAQDGEDPDTQGLAELAAAMPAEETQLLYSLCLHGRTELGLAPDEYAALTMVLLRLLAFKPQAGMAEKKSPLTSRKRPAEPAASPAGAAHPPAEPVSPPLDAPRAALTTDELPPWEDLPHAASSAAALRTLPVREVPEPSARLDMPRAVAPAAVQTTPEGDVWMAVVQGLLDQESIAALVRELALQSQLVGREGGQWRLRVERETLNHPASRERLQAALLAAGHGDIQLSIEIGPVSDSPARRLAVKAAEKMLAAQELIQSDPLVQAMVRDFGAKIVPGSIQLI
jgi:DNA polymerase-3 subunit gamma/tau